MSLASLPLSVLAYAAIGAETPTAAPPVVQSVAPVYPPIALAARVIGYIVLDVDIDKDGKVTEGHVIRAIPLLDKASLLAAQKWRFEPASDMKPRSARLTFAFDLVCVTKAGEAVPSIQPPPYRVIVRAGVQGNCENLGDRRYRAFKDMNRAQAEAGER